MSLPAPSKRRKTRREGKEAAILVAIVEEEGRGLLKFLNHEVMSLTATSKEERLREGMEVAIIVVLADEGSGVVSFISSYLPASPRK